MSSNGHSVLAVVQRRYRAPCYPRRVPALFDAAIVSASVVACLSASVCEAAADRPEPLADESGCEHYRGTSSGNDPSVQLDVVLCPHADGTAGKVEGKVQWSSLRSGWNLRRVEGQWTGASLRLRDLEIIDERPENGYTFCTIDAYALERGDRGTLAGSYDSRACRDHASVSLMRVNAPADAKAAPEPAPAPSLAQPQPQPQPRPQPPVRDASPPAKQAQQSSGCGCDLRLALVLLPLGLVRRRRRAGEPRAGGSRARD